VPDADLFGDPVGVLEFGRRERLALGGAGDGVVAEGVVGDGGDDRGVDASRKGDQDSVTLGEVSASSVEFGRDGSHRVAFGTRREKSVASRAVGKAR